MARAALGDSDSLKRPPLPVDDDSVLVILDPRTVKKLDLHTGQMIWEYRESELMPVIGPPVLMGRGDLLLLLHEGRTLIRLDAATGSRRWTCPVGLEDLSRLPAAMAFDDRRFYCISRYMSTVSPEGHLAGGRVPRMVERVVDGCRRIPGGRLRWRPSTSSPTPSPRRSKRSSRWSRYPSSSAALTPAAPSSGCSSRRTPGASGPRPGPVDRPAVRPVGSRHVQPRPPRCRDRDAARGLGARRQAGERPQRRRCVGRRDETPGRRRPAAARGAPCIARLWKNRFTMTDSRFRMSTGPRAAGACCS